MKPASLIVMMTDFGTEHWYCAAMKGEILRRAPEAQILDLSHHVPRHEVEHAAFILHCAIDSFPPQTIFLCVVDPGVGSKRRALVGRVGKYGFVGPDNGLITPLLNRHVGADLTLHEIKALAFRNPKISATFHGRDLFAPAAARLLLGDDPRMAGPRVADPLILPSINARQEEGRIVGKVMMVDHFGNAITNIDEESYGGRFMDGDFELRLKSLKIYQLENTYDDRPKGQPLCYWGSSRFLEIAVNFDSAARMFDIQPGDPVTVSPRS